MPHARGRRSVRTYLLYAVALGREFRWTLVGVGLALALGAALVSAGTGASGARLAAGDAIFAAWMALIGEQAVGGSTWYLELMLALYPLVGFVLVGEGVVRLAMLMISRDRGEKEWTRVMATTYRNHVILCGLGHLGYRVLEQLVAARIPVVALEKTESCRFLAQARATETPILLRDMKDDRSLLEAGVEHARAIIIATNDDMANLEVALDARRFNPGIRIVMRLFDQQIASKIASGFNVDVAFSSSALAAPIVAAMSQEGRILASYSLAGVPHVVAELAIDEASPHAGFAVREVEARLGGRVVARVCSGHVTESPPAPDAVVARGDRLVVHSAADRLLGPARSGGSTA